MTMEQKKCIIISGGSRGLGLELVKFCLNKGYSVVTFARKITNEIEKIMSSNSEDFLFQIVDLSDVKMAKSIVDIASDKFGIIYGLVNNAAIAQDNLLTHTRDDEIHRIITVNLESQIVLTKYVIRKMLIQGLGGRIVNISSIASIRGYSGLTVYSATKAAINAFTRTLAQEVGSKGILVNAIAPGFFESDMSSVLTKEQLEIIIRRTPTLKLIKIEDILPVFNLLMFEDINVTGQTFLIDGGASI